MAIAPNDPRRIAALQRAAPNSAEARRTLASLGVTRTSALNTVANSRLDNREILSRSSDSGLQFGSQLQRTAQETRFGQPQFGFSSGLPGSSDPFDPTGSNVIRSGLLSGVQFRQAGPTIANGIEGASIRSSDGFLQLARGSGFSAAHNRIAKQVQQWRIAIEKGKSRNAGTRELQAAANAKANLQRLTDEFNGFTGTGGETIDNRITNALVDRGELPESEREIFPQRSSDAGSADVSGVPEPIDPRRLAALVRAAPNSSRARAELERLGFSPAGEPLSTAVTGGTGGGTTQRSGDAGRGRGTEGGFSFPGATTSGNLFDDPTFKGIFDQIQDDRTRRDEALAQATEQLRGQTQQRASAFDRLFGEGSRLSSFFEPSIRTIEQTILDVEGQLEGLEESLQKSTENVQITQGGFNRLEARERGELVDQLSKLGRAHERLRAGFDQTLTLANKEFDLLTEQAQNETNAALLELENAGFTDAERSLIGAALNAQTQLLIQDRIQERELAQQALRDSLARSSDAQELSEKQQKEKADGVEKILKDAMETVLDAGVVPTENFQKVINDARRMAEGGASLAEIQLAVLQAIGQNPQVRAAINAEFKRPSTSTAPTTKSTKLTPTDKKTISFATGTPTAEIPDAFDDLTAEQREALNKKDELSAIERLIEQAQLEQ